jgi:hypothetical protein
MLTQVQTDQLLRWFDKLAEFDTQIRTAEHATPPNPKAAAYIRQQRAAFEKTKPTWSNV